ncbi:YqgE/AlgH family protein, partial [Candidatus Binatus sp.]
MRAFSIKRRVSVLTIVIAALIATLATSRVAQSTDLTTPSFLVATRDLQDPLFQHSVILMVPSTEPPLLAGLIINSPAKQRVRDLFPQVRDLKGQEEPIYTGGPVELDEISIIFRSSSAQSSATLVFDDVYVATGRDAIA